MHVLFINPDTRDKSIIYGNRMLNPPPINLAYRSAMTGADHEVTVVDENAGPFDYDPVVDDVDLVAITSKFFAEHRVRELVRRFRAAGRPVVVDGYYATYEPDVEGLGATSVIRGEVEEVWPRVLADAEKGTLRRTYAGGPVDLAGLPLYKPSDLPPHDYVFPVEATRGCPFSCNFCIETRFHHESFRTRPVADVVEQIRLGSCGFVHFSDINIVGKPGYAEDLFREMAPLNVLWGSQSTITIAKSPSRVELAAESGCMMVFIGLESVRPENLASSDKAWSRPVDYPAMIRRLHDAGIAVIGSFVFGFETDTPDVFKRTLDFVMENEIEICHFNPLVADLGTPIRDDYIAEGRLLDPGPNGPSHLRPSVMPAGMTAGELADGLAYLYTNVYSRDGIRRRLRRHLGAEPLPGPNPAEKKRAIVGLNTAYRRAVERHYGVERDHRAERGGDRVLVTGEAG